MNYARIFVLSLACALPFLGGCSAAGMALVERSIENSTVACIEGSGPPMTGSGKVAVVRVDPEFKGTIRITPDCGIEVSK